MDRMPALLTPPIALGLDAVREWTLGLTEVQRRLGAHRARRAVRRPPRV